MILANDCTYDTVLGLKQSSTYSAANGSPRTEVYGYDSNFDYLTGATYNDGLANGSPTWTYDAGGNRTDSVCDNLNRTTSISGTSTTCDSLGNRTALGSTTTYAWDCLNRMTSFTNSTGTMSYQYRADGMRTRKSTTSGFTEYYHDGQMPMEDAVVSGTSLTATRYGLGARGIDYEEVATGTYTNGTTRTVGSYSNVGFPIYDAHGNMTATLARSNSGYQVNNQRSYDAWGAIRQGTATADPKNRYCASLGHQQDDESGLIYMRARYYEPGSGRFVSQDPVADGLNWFTYANCDPVDQTDVTGKRGEAFQIGDFWVAFDRFYDDGAGRMADYNWGFTDACKGGAIRFDGQIKHGADAPEALKALLQGNKKFQKWLGRCTEHTGRSAGIGMTSLDTAFMADPMFVIGLFDDIGQGFHMFANLQNN